MSEAYKYLDKELSKVYGTDEDITLAKSILVMFLEDYHKEASKMRCPFCENITEHTIIDAKCDECCKPK